MKKTITFLLMFLVLFVGYTIPARALAESPYYTLSSPWDCVITHEIIVTNDTDTVINDLDVTIPLMDQELPPYQELLIEELSPRAITIKRNELGQREAVYNITKLNIGEKIVFKQKYSIRSYAINYKIDAVVISNDYSQNINASYLLADAGIESDNPEIIAFAKSIVGNEQNPYLIAKKVFSAVNLWLDYQVDANSNTGALNALHTKKGVCEEYSNLFIACMRSLGIPARSQRGYLCIPKEHFNDVMLTNNSNSVDISTLSHLWPEFYLEDIGWIPVDPTFVYTIEFNNKIEKLVDWNRFANISSDKKYLVFRQGGTADNTVAFTYADGKNPQVVVDTYLNFGETISPFYDVLDHWAKDAVLELYKQGIVSGLQADYFGVQENITRAEMAAMITGACDTSKMSKLPKVFTDVSTEHWAYKNIDLVANTGLMSGYPDGTFRPNDTVNRAEMAAILVRIYNIPELDCSLKFKDLGQPGYGWADNDILILANRDLIFGTDVGYYSPAKNVTRAEFAVAMWRVMNYQS